MLSIVIPSYNEEENIKNTAEVVLELMDKSHVETELVFVDDGSSDLTWDKICSLHSADPRVRGVRLSRHFGKEGGILAGLRASRGDAVCVMDCDLQHPPETILSMLKLWQKGAMVGEGKKSSSGEESRLYSSLSGLFYRLMCVIVMNMHNTSDFKLLDRRVVEAITSLPERGTFFRALSGWVGFESKTVYYDVAKRAYGKRKWSVFSLIVYALRNIISFSSLPLHIASVLGGVISAAAVIMLILLAFGCGLGSFTPASLLILLTLGLILCCLGILGSYIARIYEETRRRPRYIVASTTDSPEDGGRSRGA